MVYRTEIKIKPIDLTDLTVTTDLSSWNLEQFTIEDNALIGDISATDDTTNVTISSTGFITQTIVYSDIPPTIYLIPVNEVETLSNGTNNYPIADKISRLMLEDKADKSEIPVIPTVNNATLTIQKNGTTVNTFTANASSNVTANITVPTNTNELTNGAGFITGINSSDVTTALGYTPADDSNVVKTTGNQTISNTKTFTTNLVRKTDLTAGTPPTSDTSGSVILIRDSNDTNIGGLNYTYYSTGAFNVNLRANNPANTSSYANLRIGYTENGTVMTAAPTPNEDTTSSVQIDTVGARNTKLSNYVALSSNNTFTGDNTFEKEIKAELASYVAYNGNTNTLPYKKIGEVVLNGTSASAVVPFLYFRTNVEKSSNNYLGKIVLRTDGTTAGHINTGSTGIVLDEVPDYINSGDINFYVLYKESTPDSSKVTFEFWVYLKNTWTGFSITPLKQSTGGAGYSMTNWTWYNNPTGVAEIPSGYTGQIEKSIISNYIATPTASDDSKKVANTEFVHDAIALDAVTLTGDQDVDGHKTYGPTGIRLRNPSLTKGTNPSSTTYMNVPMLEKSGADSKNRLGCVETAVYTNGLVENRLMAYKNEANSTAYSYMSICYPTSGNPYAICPTPTEDTTSSTQIDTVGARNTKLQNYALDNSVVKLAGEQTITGLKTFTKQVTKTNSSANADTIFVNKNTAITKGTAPSTSVESRWRLTDSSTGDSNSALIGGVDFMYDTNNRTGAFLQVGKPEASSTATARLGIMYPSTGSAYTEAPTPTENTTSSTQIDTVGARNTKLASYANLSSNNSFSGNNTYNGVTYINSGIDTFDTRITKGTTPTSTLYSGVFRINSDNYETATSWQQTRLGVMEYSLTNAGDSILQFGVYKNEANSTANSMIQIRYNANGTRYATLSETPATSDNSTKIATTGYVKAQDYATNSTLSSSPYLVLYGTSTSAAADTAKIVEISSSYATTPTISAGQLLIVKPTITSTVADSTITVQKSSTTLLAAKTMKYNNTNITTSTDSIVWSANIPSIFVYDGTYWVFLGHGLDNNTTYSAMSVSEGTTGTATSSRVMRADYLKQIIEGLAISQTNTYYDSSTSTLYIG